MNAVCHAISLLPRRQPKAKKKHLLTTIISSILLRIACLQAFGTVRDSLKAAFRPAVTNCRQSADGPIMTGSPPLRPPDRVVSLHSRPPPFMRGHSFFLSMLVAVFPERWRFTLSQKIVPPAQAKLLRDSIVQQPLRYTAGLSRNAAAHPRDPDAPTSPPFAPSVHACFGRAARVHAGE
jgi:hypothetical protein